MATTTFSGPVVSTNGFVGAVSGAVSASTLSVSSSAEIGASATDTVGFFGATAVAQPATTGTTTGFTAGSGTAVLDDSTFTGDTGSTAYTIGDVVKALKDLGLLAA